MVRPAHGGFAVNRNLRPSAAGWGVLIVSLAALTLSGCGRKGGLDLPPSAASSSTENVAQPPTTETAEANRGSVFNPSYGTDAAPAASKGSKKPFILDPLLGN